MDPEAGSVVERELPCAGCGYDLRGISIAGNCPECGLAVALSNEEPLLRYADLAWVKGLARGTSVIVGGLAAAVGGLLLIGMTHGILDNSPATRFIEGAVEAGISSLFLWGCWQLTQPDPGRGTREDPRCRSVFRWSALVVFGLHVAWVGVRLIDRQAALGMEALAAVAGVVALLAGMRFGEHLAERIPDHVLRRSIRTARRGLTAVIFSALGCFVIHEVQTPNAHALLEIVGTVVGLAGALLGVWSLVLFVGYHQRLSTAARQAVEHRSTAEA